MNSLEFLILFFPLSLLVLVETFSCVIISNLSLLFNLVLYFFSSFQPPLCLALSFSLSLCDMKDISLINMHYSVTVESHKFSSREGFVCLAAAEMLMIQLNRIWDVKVCALSTAVRRRTFLFFIFHVKHFQRCCHTAQLTVGLVWCVRRD